VSIIDNSNVNIDWNTTPYDGAINLKFSDRVDILRNVLSAGNYSMPTGLGIYGSGRVKLEGNTLLWSQQNSVSSFGVRVARFGSFGPYENQSVKFGKVLVLGNNIIGSRNYGIYVLQTDSVYVSGNKLDGGQFSKEVYYNQEGIFVQSQGSSSISIDSNDIRNFKDGGIRFDLSDGNSKFKVRGNVVRDVNGFGILMYRGLNPWYTPSFDLDSNEVVGNRIFSVASGVGLGVQMRGLYANNYINIGGLGDSKGISIQDNGAGSKIVGNSVHVLGKVNCNVHVPFHVWARHALFVPLGAYG
jgi:hypothetical protein